MKFRILIVVFSLIGALSAAPAYSQLEATVLNDIQLVITPTWLLERAEQHREMLKQVERARRQLQALEDEETGEDINGNGETSVNGVLAYAGKQESVADFDPVRWYGSTSDPVSLSNSRKRPRWYSYASGSYSYLDNDDPLALFDGSSWAGSLGTDYEITSTFIAGLTLTYDNSDLSTNFPIGGRGSMSNEGIGIGPYAVLALGEYFSLSSSFLYSWRDNDIKDMFSSASFDSESWMANAALSGNFQSRRTTFSPNVGLSFSSTDDESYTDSSGMMYPSQSIDIASLTFGASISQTIHRGLRSSTTAWISGDGVWAFDVSSTSPVAASDSINKEGVSGSVSGGLDFALPGRVNLSLSGRYGGIGIDNYDEISANASIGILY